MDCNKCSTLSDVMSLKQQGELQEADSLISSLIASSSKTYGAKKGCSLCGLENLYNERGQIRYLMVDFNEAVDDYTRALQVNPRLAVTLYNRGQIHYRMGRYKDAIRDFESALAIDSDFPDAHEGLHIAKMDKQKGGKNTEYIQ